MKCWVVGLTLLSALLALAGLTFTAAGFANARREAEKEATLEDVHYIRKVIASFVYGSKIWQPYLGIGLTALSVLAGSAAGLIGTLSAS